MREILKRPLITALLMVAALAACGFTPVYAPGSQSAATLSNIRLAPPTDERGYIFVREMESRLGRNDNATRILGYRFRIAREGVGSVTGRRRVVGSVTYTVTDTRKKSVIAKGKVDSFTGYSVTGGIIDGANRDAVERLVIILADKVTHELIAKLAPI